jgi:hypothetical protein
MFNVSLDAYREYLFKIYGWPLEGPLGLLALKRAVFTANPVSGREDTNPIV